MFEKIKSFCQKKEVRIVSLVAFAASAGVLLIGGISEADLAGVVKAVIGLIAAFATIAELIKSLLNKEI